MAHNRFRDSMVRGGHYAQRDPLLPKARWVSETYPAKSLSAGVHRLAGYFMCDRFINELRPYTRKIGLEVETLFIDRTSGRPICRETSQKMLLRLVSSSAWKIKEIKGDTIVRLAQAESTLIFDLGWNNVELVTPTWPADRFLFEGLAWTNARLTELYAAAEYYNARPAKTCYDGHADLDTLVMPDERDQIWTELDGPILCSLGHIASVHVNIDLKSMSEGFEFIKQLNKFYKDHDWPPKKVREIWERYIAKSYAEYEPTRYGPPPETRSDYLRQLAGYKVMMNTSRDGELQRMTKAETFYQIPIVDYELFVRSVWWWNRLRVRNNHLVLEARGIPRGNDTHLRRDVADVLSLLDL
ncbi:hypothetical protein GF391_01375 [Candidatus Uhrbacteria bacterium]|nr:hypothetical protein [Candidatus Uhrbacteria bacterium]